MLIALVVAAVLVLTGLVLLRDDDERGADDEVELSAGGPFPARGDLLDDDELVEGGARLWRDQRSGDTPDGSVTILYADTVSGDRLPLYGDDRAAEAEVVVMTDGRRSASAGRLPDGRWTFLGVATGSPSESRRPVLAVGADLHLLSDEVVQQTDALAVVELPQESDEGPVDEDRAQPVVDELDVAEGPLVSLDARASGDFAVLLPEQEGRPETIAWLGSDVGDQPMLLTARHQTESTLWERLVSERDGAGTAAALRHGIGERFAKEKAPVTQSVELAVQHLGASSGDVPGGTRRVNAVAIGTEQTRFSTLLVAAGLTGDDGRTVPLTVGRRAASTPDSPPVSATWVQTRDNVGTFLVYAAAPTLDLQLRIGPELLRPRSSVGIVVPTATKDGWLPTSLIGLDDAGQSWPALPISAAGTREG